MLYYRKLRGREKGQILFAFSAKGKVQSKRGVNRVSSSKWEKQSC